MIKPTWFLVAVSLFSPVALANTTSLGEQRSKDTPAQAFKCGLAEALEKSQSWAPPSTVSPKQDPKATAVAIDAT